MLIEIKARSCIDDNYNNIISKNNIDNIIKFRIILDWKNQL